MVDIGPARLVQTLGRYRNITDGRTGIAHHVIRPSGDHQVLVELEGDAHGHGGARYWWLNRFGPDEDPLVAGIHHDWVRIEEAPDAAHQHHRELAARHGYPDCDYYGQTE